MNKFLKCIALLVPVIAGVVISLITIIKLCTGVEVTTADQSVSIIALAVAVWTGINISNVVERTEFDDLRDRFAKKKEEFEQAEASNKRDLEKVEAAVSDFRDSNDVYLRREIEEIHSLLQTSDDGFYRYLGTMYENEEMKDEDSKYYSKESLKSNAFLVNQIRNVLNLRYLHEKGDFERKEYLYDDAGKTIDTICEADKNSEFKFIAFSRNLLSFILGDAYFYRAFSRYDVGPDGERYVEVAQLFLSAEKQYIRLYPYFVTDDAPEIVVRYYRNSIAQCYSEIILCYAKSGKDDKEKLQEILPLDQAIDKAVEWSKGITGDSDGRYRFADERYYKNNGLLYDRIAMVGNPEDYEKNIELAISNYEQAFRYGNQPNTYHVICSAYNNLIKRYLNKDKDEDCITPVSKVSIWSKDFVPREMYPQIKQKSDKLISVSKSALKIWPLNSFYTCMSFLGIMYSGIPQDIEHKKQILKDLNKDVEQYFHGKKESELSGLEKCVLNVLKNINKDMGDDDDDNKC